MREFLVDHPDGQDRIRCQALSFDGGSLILFVDPAMTRVVAAYGPAGWLHGRWSDEVRSES